MMKNILSFLAILLLANMHSCSDEFLEHDPEVARAEAEQEIYNCFKKLETAEYTLSEKKITKIPLEIYDKPYGNFYSLAKDALKFISKQLFNKDDGGKELWTIASKVYQLYMADKEEEKAIPFHNICHGMHTMLYSMLLLNSTFAKRDGDEKQQLMYGVHGGELDIKNLKLALVGYAGLFHDAGHNGYGNGFYKTASDDLVNLYDGLLSGLKEQEGWDYSSMGDSTNLEKGIVQLKNKLEALKGTNKENDFIWERIHAEIADAIYVVFNGDTDSDNRELVKRLILNTNMAHGHREYENKAFISLIRQFSKDNEAVKYSDWVKGPFQKEVQDMDSIVHVADISLNASNNSFLIFLQAPLVLKEFHDEMLKTLDIKAFDKIYQASSTYGALCKNKTFATLYSAGQTGFNNFMVKRTYNNKPFFSKYVLEKEVPSRIDALLKEYSLALDGFVKTEYSAAFAKLPTDHKNYKQLKDKVDAIEELITLKNELLKDGIAIDAKDEPHISYLLTNLERSNKLFKLAVETSDADYMSFDETSFKKACRITDRRLKVQRKVVRKTRKLII